MEEKKYTYIVTKSYQTLGCAEMRQFSTYDEADRYLESEGERMMKLYKSSQKRLKDIDGVASLCKAVFFYNDENCRSEGAVMQMIPVEI